MSILPRLAEGMLLERPNPMPCKTSRGLIPKRPQRASNAPATQRRKRGDDSEQFLGIPESLQSPQHAGRQMKKLNIREIESVGCYARYSQRTIIEQQARLSHEPAIILLRDYSYLEWPAVPNEPKKIAFVVVETKIALDCSIEARARFAVHPPAPWSGIPKRGSLSSDIAKKRQPLVLISIRTSETDTPELEW